MSTEDFRILGISLLGPLVGSLAGVSFKPGERLLMSMLSFAGGTMLGISFLEMLPESMALCGLAGCVCGIAIGVLVMLLAGELMEGYEKRDGRRKDKLERAALMMTAAIFLHNLPEGIAMAAGTRMSGGGKAMLIAIAIAAHDIPEGICTSAPYYYATGKRLRAFLQSASTALPVIVGFFLGKSVFAHVSDFFMGVTVGAIAGMMIYISCKELIPASQEGRGQKLSMAALMAGIIFVLILGSIKL